MFRRIVATAFMLFLAFLAFWWNALGQGHIANPFGILYLFLAAIVWFKWDLVRDAFASVKDESDIPIIRLGSNIIGGMSVAHALRPPKSK